MSFGYLGVLLYVSLSLSQGVFFEHTLPLNPTQDYVSSMLAIPFPLVSH